MKQAGLAGRQSTVNPLRIQSYSHHMLQSFCGGITITSLDQEVMIELNGITFGLE